MIVEFNKSCELLKSTRAPVLSRVGTVSAANRIAEVYKNVAGSEKIQSMAKSKTFVTVGVEYSGYVFVRSIHRKSEAASRVIVMNGEIEILFNSAVRKLSCINWSNVSWMRLIVDGRMSKMNSSTA